MDKKKLSFLVIAGIILIIGIISAFLLLGGKDEVTQPVGENEGVTVNVDKKDRNEDEIKEDFEETVDNEREKEKRPVGIVDLPELTDNATDEEEEIQATDIKEEINGDNKAIKGNTVNGNTITVVTPNNEKNPNIKIIDGVEHNFSSVGNLPIVETPKSDNTYVDENGRRMMKPHVNELAKKVENIYKNTDFTFYSIDGRDSFSLNNKTEAHSFVNDEGTKIYRATLHSDGKTYYDLAAKGAVKMGASVEEKELLNAINSLFKEPYPESYIEVGKGVNVDRSGTHVIISWK